MRSDNITAASVAMKFGALYLFYLGGQLFVSAIRTLRCANQMQRMVGPISSVQTSDPSFQGALIQGLNAQASQSKLTALGTAAVGGLLMYSAYSTGSLLYAGEAVSTASTVLNGLAAVAGVRNLINSI